MYIDLSRTPASTTAGHSLQAGSLLEGIFGILRRRQVLPAGVPPPYQPPGAAPTPNAAPAGVPPVAPPATPPVAGQATALPPNTAAGVPGASTAANQQTETGFGGAVPVDLTGIDPAAFSERPANEPSRPLNLGTDLGKSGKFASNSDLRRWKTSKSEMATAIIVLLIVAVLALSALARYKWRQRARANATEDVLRAEPLVTEGIEPGERGSFRVRRPEMAEQQQPGPRHRFLQRHRNGLRKSHHKTLQRRGSNPRGRVSREATIPESHAVVFPAPNPTPVIATATAITPAGVAPTISSAKERYYRG